MLHHFLKFSLLKLIVSVTHFLLWLFFLFLNTNQTVSAQEKTTQTIKDTTQTKKKYLKNIVKLDIGLSSGRIGYSDEDGNTRYHTRLTGIFSFSVHLFEEVYVRGSLFEQVQNKNLPPWLADYYYSIGRFNWRPKTFSYGYENYAPNKFKTTNKTFVERLSQGQFFVSYQHNLPKNFLNSIKIDKSTNWSIAYYVKYSAFYQDAEGINHGGIVDGKILLGVGTRYTIAKKIYIEGSANYYPQKDKKLPWDPDFTYSFGYVDWKPCTIAFSYGNWVANRFPWNKKEIKGYGFLDGDFKLSFSYAW
ncbi:MAG: hypothetical protein H0W84_03050 [Bacteroidetes bacterium]|nr:hypothetical protein [Bacteroidota bacterium]